MSSIQSGSSFSRSESCPAELLLVQRLMTMYQEKGGNSASLLKAAGIRETLKQILLPDFAVTNPQKLAKLADKLCVALADVDARSAGREPYRTTDWAILFYCLVGSRDLDEAIERMATLFSSIDGRMGYLQRSFRGGQVELQVVGLSSDDSDPNLSFVVKLNGLLMYHRILSWLIGGSLGGYIELPFPESCRNLADELLFPLELVLDAERSTIVFPGHLLGSPVIRSIEDEESQSSLTFLLGNFQSDEPREFALRVRQILRESLVKTCQLLSADEVCAQLEISPATVRRRLQSSGTSFRSIRDDVRKARAVQLLADRTMPMEVVAEKLGFCDSDAFRQAVKSWFGSSPSAYRRAMLHSIHQ